MKDYQRKVIEKFSLPREHLEVLDLLQPSITTLLDYLIKVLEPSVTNEINLLRLKPSTIDTWKKTLELIKQARSLYL